IRRQGIPCRGACAQPRVPQCHRYTPSRLR
ncbi:hypothetical protein BN1723_020293, partial [Verticillium longisporum]